jgi:zinc and cadmium transporter
MILLQILLATFLITLCVWVAVFFLIMKKDVLSKITLFLVSLSAGALIGGAFLHLLPEASETMNPNKVFIVTLSAFILFFFIEKVLHWRHCHNDSCETHTYGHMSLIGDSIHNFIDGLVIAGAFLLDAKIGVATTLAIALHEIPQEIGDFGVLVHAGFEKMKALALNYAVALMVVAGGVVGYFVSFYSENITSYLIPFAAGGFIYIAASDLMPEARKEKSLKKSMASFLFFLIGIILMYLLKFIGV